MQVNLNLSKSPQSLIYLNICPKFPISHLHFIYTLYCNNKSIIIKKIKSKMSTGGLEPPRLSPHAPQACMSTIPSHRLLSYKISIHSFFLFWKFQPCFCCQIFAFQEVCHISCKNSHILHSFFIFQHFLRVCTMNHIPISS